MRNSALKLHLQYHGRGKIVTVKDSQARSSCSTKTDVFISTPVLKGSPLNPLTPRVARCPTPHTVRLKSASVHRFYY